MNNNHELNLLKLATEIATHLEGFTAGQEDYGPVVIRHSDGRRLNFSYTLYDQKINIYGRYGKDFYGQWATPVRFGIVKNNKKAKDKIHVSSNRTVKAIAKDIKRRLLPHYSQYFFKIAEHVAQQREENSWVNKRILEVSEKLGSRSVKGQSDYIKTAYFSFESILRGKIQTSNGEDYTIELSGVPHSVALEMARLLQNYKK
ncbi:hypothetical protein G7B40_031515 [Aetokthonos hydrillicola Thurmond2011]|jgi:hypothetical protein|uniref:Uncharacterized protein n=1 Tax=Aetokthonos hydrillicola Thurmond2011 TaxID=2712845 RepID=A0AAP5IGU0_9CYAN|nr:hypothetical protein [Aetokthonos hydrillicola]MBO3462858.1 hypothetical protein [Aetokthonos hydrillicola CCALA 1050]MBW4590975.1 hypothetical protein [Aetokthonos hydrillicola CCALA 1050]MDR9899055.1 hypothetical protein [Aetokthonos hydrillicola Thurmond2011]